MSTSIEVELQLQDSESNSFNLADIIRGVEAVFHDAATVPDNGNVIAVKGYKTLSVDIYGTATSLTVTFYGKGASGELRTIQGIKRSDYSLASSTTTLGQLWQFDVSGLESVVLDLTAVSGGNVSIKGWLEG
jgi:hypothetical protein